MTAAWTVVVMVETMAAWTDEHSAVQKVASMDAPWVVEKAVSMVAHSVAH